MRHWCCCLTRTLPAGYVDRSDLIQCYIRRTNMLRANEYGFPSDLVDPIHHRLTGCGR
ncbi:hypothetical protein BGLA2_860024 [Burkholderia gladioli]|nr:hypothetical protein BGLA2_860024 [Burkholderia gladioli]